MNGEINVTVKLNQAEITKRYNGIVEDILYIYENTSTYDFLEFKLGMKPPKKLTEILEFLLIEKELTPSIVNALVDYAMNTNNEINKESLTELANQCIENDVLTTEEVMEYLKTM